MIELRKEVQKFRIAVAELIDLDLDPESEEWKNLWNQENTNEGSFYQRQADMAVIVATLWQIKRLRK